MFERGDTPKRSCDIDFMNGAASVSGNLKQNREQRAESREPRAEDKKKKKMMMMMMMMMMMKKYLEHEERR